MFYNKLYAYFIQGIIRIDFSGVTYSKAIVQYILDVYNN